MSVTKGEKVRFFEKIKKLYRGVTGEMKKVHWPNKKEITTYTAVVLVSVFLIGAIIWIFDSGVSFLMKLFVE